MVLLIGSTGLRRSEMIALTWSDLNIRTMEVILEKSVRPALARIGVVGKQIGWHSFRHSLDGTFELPHAA
jgi:integrase